MKLPENYLAAMKELLGEEYEAYLASFEEPKSLGLRRRATRPWALTRPSRRAGWI